MDQESNLAKCKTWSWAKVSHATLHLSLKDWREKCEVLETVGEVKIWDNQNQGTVQWVITSQKHKITWSQTCKKVPPIRFYKWMFTVQIQKKWVYHKKLLDRIVTKSFKYSKTAWKSEIGPTFHDLIVYILM